jgi:general bacterial porin, GBP family
MKKSIIALAALGAFAGAASAQSSVTLYGRAELNATYSKPGDLVGGGDERYFLNDGGANSGIGGSRWGLRGSEDLGGGLKAYFVLEAAFNADDGSQAAPGGFQRQSYVALGSATLGDVRLGRQESISRLINSGFSDSSGIGELKIDEAVGGGRQLFQTFGQRVNNVATYISPSFGGFQVQAMVGAGEGANARYQGIMGSYKNGPLAVALGYEEYDSFGARTSAFNKVFHVGGNYNFGVATVYAGYQDSTDVGANTGAAIAAAGVRDQQAWNVGVMVPVGNFQIRGNYTHVDYDLNNGQSADQQKYGVSVRYALSKRTTLYSALTMRDGETNGLDVSEAFTQKTEFTVLGLAHTF